MGIQAQGDTVPGKQGKALMRRGVFWALTAILLLPSWLEAQITRIEFTRVESPTFEGRVFGDVGQYEKLVGVAFGES